MFLRLQNFDFAQIQSNLPKSRNFCPISLQFFPNRTNSIFPKAIKKHSNHFNFSQSEMFAIGDAVASLASPAPTVLYIHYIHDKM